MWRDFFLYELCVAMSIIILSLLFGHSCLHWFSNTMVRFLWWCWGHFWWMILMPKSLLVDVCESRFFLAKGIDVKSLPMDASIPKPPSWQQICIFRTYIHHFTKHFITSLCILFIFCKLLILLRWLY